VVTAQAALTVMTSSRYPVKEKITEKLFLL
jgi:hypothetical protein